MEKSPLDSVFVKGYILVPKALMESRLADRSKVCSEFEAFMLVLCHVNYRDATFDVYGTDELCKRGESFRSMQTWADMFGWSRAKTRRYFEKLEKINVIMLLAHKRTTHIRVINYDLWTGVRKDAYKKDPNYEKEFQEFWDYYHETTQMRKVNIARAKKEWSMLTAEERKLAYKNVDNYYYYLTNTRYCKQADSYLKDKSFLDED